MFFIFFIFILTPGKREDIISDTILKPLLIPSYLVASIGVEPIISDRL